MIRNRLRLCSRRCRYIICIILIAIVLITYLKHERDLHHSIELRKCKKLLLNELSDKAKKYIYFQERRSTVLNATKLRRWILRRNAQNRVLNMDLYGPLTANTIIFVVQIRHYSPNIKYLLASLSEVDGIHDALIIFSHSYVDYSLNSLLQSIEFCRILQIFYPYSVQAYPNEFPGYDKNDCLTNINNEVTIQLNCTNAMNPDVYGQYRDPIKAEKKHHWWWTANKVFEDLSYTTKHKGIIVFLETNFYIYKNFIYIANAMKSIAMRSNQYNFLSLGTIKDPKRKNMYDLELTTWNPMYHSNILAIDLSVWNIIKFHYKIFCRIDDWSWSRSIFDISINHRGGNVFKVLSSGAAKRLEMSSVDDTMGCDVMEDIVEIINLEKLDREVLFPRYFKVFHNIELYEDELSIADYVEIGGGWNDQRDKQLCSNMTLVKAKQHFVTETTRHLEDYDY